MLDVSGTYRIKGFGSIFVVSFGDGTTALFVDKNNVEPLCPDAWSDDKFIPLASPITITFPGASQ